MSIKVGASIWVPCEVKPGPFSNERLTRVELPSGAWIGFVPVDYIREPIESGLTAVLAKVIHVENGLFRATIPGYAFNSTPISGEIDKVVAVGTVQAGHPSV